MGYRSARGNKITSEFCVDIPDVGEVIVQCESEIWNGYVDESLIRIRFTDYSECPLFNLPLTDVIMYDIEEMSLNKLYEEAYNKEWFNY